MRDGGRLQAGIEVLELVFNRYLPLSEALRDWGRSHRFAGSGDRAVIGNLTHDALRNRSSLAWRMDDDSPRALILATYAVSWGNGVDGLKSAIAEDQHAPSALSDGEMTALNEGSRLKLAPDWVQADVPEWLWPAFEGNFHEDAVAEGQALAGRPDLDVRVNSLKGSLEKARKALKRFDPQPAPVTPVGLRIKARPGARRLPHIQAEAIYQKGGIEIQDAGSQTAALLVDAKPGEQVLDYCAGGGGKTLAMAAEMQNKGQIFAFDADKRRLAPIHERLKRADVRNVQVIQPPGTEALSALEGKMDRVLVDAPCTGSGVWRRRPDTKWRLSEAQLESRLQEQQAVLADASKYVRKGGFLIYVTCSVLAEENEGQVYQFVEDNPDFELVSAGEVWEDKFGYDQPKPWSSDGCTVLMTPNSTHTDGFFLAVLERRN